MRGIWHKSVPTRRGNGNGRGGMGATVGYDRSAQSDDTVYGGLDHGDRRSCLDAKRRSNKSGQQIANDHVVICDERVLRGFGGSRAYYFENDISRQAEKMHPKKVLPFSTYCGTLHALKDNTRQYFYA